MLQGNMYNKKYNIALVCLIFLMAIVPFVASAPPFLSGETTTAGLIVEPSFQNYHQTGEDFEFEVHVFNQSNGAYIIADTTCFMHLYDKDGSHLYEGVDNEVSHDFDYSFDLNGTNFTKRGEYVAKFQCNSTNGLAGGTQEIFYVNDYGEELSDAEASSFNYSMIFMMILFIMALIGLFTIDNYIGKFALYWVCHLLFIVGTFSIWQFNMGYTIGYVGLANVWKVLFYVSTISAFPMLILSLAWIFYIHTFNEHFQKLVDKGVDTESAFKMANKKRGGWFNGQ